MSTLHRWDIGTARTFVTLFAVALLSACASVPPAPTPEARSQLAPGGKLRVGLLVTNPAFVSKDGAPNEMQGVGVELARELAKQLNVAFEPVRYKNIALLLDGAKRAEWDVAPVGYSPERTADMDFTTLYAVGESKYLVPNASSIRSVADVDKPGHRVAVGLRSAQDAYLTGNLKRAEVVRTKVLSEALELMKSGKAQAYLSAGAIMTDEWLAKRPEFRMVEGGVKVGGTALAVAKGRPAGTAYAKDFVEYAKASGFVEQSIERNGLRTATVAPAGVSY
jgi:polar amino acid transport system substrate-binding protein